MKSCKNLSGKNTNIKSEKCKKTTVKPLSHNANQIRKRNTRISKSQIKKKKSTDRFKYICWIIVPIITLTLIILDAFNIYSFNKERLIVIEIGLLVILLPFFSEITLKNLSLKRKFKNENEN